MDFVEVWLRSVAVNCVIPDGAIALLLIPTKLRLSTEARRLLVRVISYYKDQYTLLSAYGQLKGRYQGKGLNSVDSSIAESLGQDIPREPPETSAKTRSRKTKNRPRASSKVATISLQAV